MVVFKYVVLFLLFLKPCFADQTYKNKVFKFNKNYQKSQSLDDVRGKELTTAMIEESYIEKRKLSVSEVNRPYKSRYYFSLGIYHNILYSDNQGAGSKAEWVSKENFNFETQYQFNIKDFWLGVKASYHIQDYEKEVNSQVTWNEKTPDLFKLSLVSDYEKERWGLGFDLDFNQVPFIYYENFFNIELKSVLIVNVSLRAQYKWLKNQNWSSRAGLGFNNLILGFNNLILSFDSDLKQGAEYLVFIDLMREKKHWGYGLNVKLYYGFNQYKSNQKSQKENIAGFLFSLESLNWL